MSFELTILGSSSATPTPNRFPSAQYLHFLEHHMLIDCGEGAQMQMSKYKIKKSKLDYIFISHIHGDHILGLPGLIFSMNLNGRTNPLHIFGPASLFEILDLFLKSSDTKLHFAIIKHLTQDQEKEVIFQNERLRVSSFPLHHRIPTTGFLFEEIDRPRKLNAEACKKHEIPVSYYYELKTGKDYFENEGKIIIPNHELTFDNGKPIRYAYCSDTCYHHDTIKHVGQVKLLYHEATFLHEKLNRAEETMHTTALQAGQIGSAAAVEQLLIGHFSSRYDDLNVLLNEAKSVFENTELATEGKTIILS
jgi:ribonuclease Z